MKNSKKLLVAVIALHMSATANAQKCDTTHIDGVPQAYYCPIRALNVFSRVHRTVHDAIFVPLHDRPVAYCSGNCKLKDWSYYHIENKWENNPQKLETSSYEPFPYTKPKIAPTGEEREPGLFLGGSLKFEFSYTFANLPAANYRFAKELESIKSSKVDSLRKAEPTDRIYNTYLKLIVDEFSHDMSDGYFSFMIQFNREYDFDYLSNESDKASLLKTTPYSLGVSFQEKYVATDILLDVSNFQESERLQDGAANPFVDYSKKRPVSDPIGKQFRTKILLGKLIPTEDDEKIVKAHDYSVYNIYIVLESCNSFEKNHEVLSRINWPLLYSIIKR